jgi:tape measure domain-containing protein
MATEEVGIRLTLRERRETAKGLQDTAGDVREIGSAAEETGRRASRALGVLRSIGSVAVGAAKIGTKALVGLAAAGGAWGLKVASGNEQAAISFTTMLGSAKKAGSFITDLQAFAAKTPFEFSGLQQSASSLLSAGIDADKIIPIMTNLGNATSGMGTGAEGVQRATVALQQMNAAQKISAEDLNQLRDAGIPVYDLLAKATGKTTAQIAQMVDKGKLGRKELGQLMDALESGKGLEKFAGLMDAQSNSVAGKWSTIKDTFGQGLARVVEPWLPTVKKALDGATGAATPFFDRLTAKSSELAKKAPAAIELVRAKFRAGKADVDSFLSGLRGGDVAGASTGLHTLGVTVGQVADSVRGADVGGALSSISAQLPVINSAVSVAGIGFGFLADHLDTLAYLMPVIAGGFVIYKAAQLGANVAAVAAVPIQIADIVTRGQQTMAMRAHTLALNANTVANGGEITSTNAGILARARATVGMVAQRAGMVAVRTATVAWTAVQWLLNGALTANPIGLVVLGIAALVAGVVVAYKKLGWFRDMVGWVFDKLSDLWDLAKAGGSLLMKLFGGGGGDDTGGGGQLPGRVAGGPVDAGQAYVVGEKRPELFVPQVKGTVVPRVPRPRAASETDGALADVASRGPVHVHLELNGREIGSAVIDDIDDRVARQ